MCALVLGGHGFLSQWMLKTTPDTSVLLLLPACGLIVVELNRPGLILAGAAGPLLTVFAGGALAMRTLHPWAVCLVLLSMSLLALNLWRLLPSWVLLGATGALCGGLRWLVPSAGMAAAVHTPVAVLTGTVLGVGAAVLSRIAFRARRAKALN